MPGESETAAPTESRVADAVDGILLVSFGGPRAPEDVMPFLERVTAGRGVPRERLELVAEHYFARGGVSPINAETAALVTALRTQLGARGREDVAVYLGNRNWSPGIDEALIQAAYDGRRHLAVVLTSAYSGYSSCRQYRENVADAVDRARDAVGEKLPALSFVRPWGLQPEVVATWGRLATEATRAALESAAGASSGDSTGAPTGAVAAEGESGACETRLVFVAHSIPLAANRASGPPDDGGAYVRELTRLAELIAAHVATEVGRSIPWSLAYCSRSGPPSQPWLEPDISDALAELAGQGVRSVAAVPIGFVADHMEVVQDLDTVAAADAATLGLAWHRAPTLRDDPAVAACLTDLALAAGEAAAPCPAGCCAPIARPGAPSTADTRAAAFEGA